MSRFKGQNKEYTDNMMERLSKIKGVDDIKFDFAPRHRFIVWVDQENYDDACNEIFDIEHNEKSPDDVYLSINIRASHKDRS